MSKFPVSAFVAAVLLLAGAPVAHAQRLSLDLVGGVNIATLQVEGAPEASVGSRVGANVGARLSLGLGPRFSLIVGAIYFQKGGTLLENSNLIERDDLNFLDFPILLQYALPTSKAGKLKVHVAVGPALEPDFVWGGVGLCVLALAGLEVQAGPGAVILDVVYNRGLSDMEYTSLGRSLRNRTVSFMAGYAFPLGSLW